jgi:hypothetical protein
MGMDTETAPQAEDGLHTARGIIPWPRVTPADIRAAAPGYAERTGVSRHRAWAALVSEWEKRRGALYD